jgi:uncharacterized protein YecE (DUF72 family)
MIIYAGTSGYSYKEWKGHFYPEKFSAADMLAYYAERLPAVEINNTFYRLPKESVLDGWAAQVPEEFRFSIKASRRITHFKRLKETDDETAYLLRALGTLGPLLGVILFQLPPNLKKDLPRLETFLDLLPPRAPAAFEFRHPSWFDDDVTGVLRDHGCALCLADTDDGDSPPLVDTGSLGYLRLRRADYSDEDLRTWANRIEEQPWDRVFVFFKHEDEAAGPRMAERFLQLVGQGTAG